MNIKNMEKPISIFLSARRKNMASSMLVFFDSKDPVQLLRYHIDGGVIYMEALGNWNAYNRILESKLFLSVEHFMDDESKQSPEYWVSTSTIGKDLNYSKS
jgi:hypothetical protein